MNWREFEEFARKIMAKHSGVPLVEKKPRGLEKVQAKRRFLVFGNQRRVHQLGFLS